MGNLFQVIRLLTKGLHGKLLYFHVNSSNVARCSTKRKQEQVAAYERACLNQLSFISEAVFFLENSFLNSLQQLNYWSWAVLGMVFGKIASTTTLEWMRKNNYLICPCLWDSTDAVQTTIEQRCTHAHVTDQSIWNSGIEKHIKQGLFQRSKGT